MTAGEYCRGNGDRRQDQDRERVLQSPSQMQQDGELQDVIAEAQRSIPFAKPGRYLAQQNQSDVEQTEAPTTPSAGRSGRRNPSP